MEITATLVKQLRDRTGAPMMDCKQALAENQGDLAQAEVWLRKKGIAAAAKKAARTASEGSIGAYIHAGGKIGVLIELACETDFVARTPEFQALLHDLAMHVAAAAPRYLSREQVPAAVLEQEKEIFRAQMKDSGKPAQVIEKIVEGKLGKFYEETCLLDQRFIKDDKMSVAELVAGKIAQFGENIAVRRFARYKVGEDLG
ncbi:MAG TPA: translation elongation factor Ts [Terriglobales bacterium]|nr:translation elongation factor Ts [Terriglobales bacterium]